MSIQPARDWSDRRAHPRLEVIVPIEIDVGLYGVTSVGSTVNLSRGGVLANVDHPIEVGEQCTIRFPKPSSRLDSVMVGRVVRSRSTAAGNLVALQFDRALPSAPGLA